MAELGINVLDTNGKLRDTGDVMTQIGNKWGSMSKEQQVNLAQTMAGQRQMNNLIALFDNWDTYTKELNTSLEANNELNEKNDIYMESLGAHLNELKASYEGLIQSLTDTDSFKSVIDLGTNLLHIFTDLSTAIGGGGNALVTFGSILTKVFSKQISGEITNVVTSIRDTFTDKNAFQQAQKNVNQLISNTNLKPEDTAVQEMTKIQQEALPYYKFMTQEEQKLHNQELLRYGTAKQTSIEYGKQLSNIQNLTKSVVQTDKSADELLHNVDDYGDQLKSVDAVIDLIKDTDNTGLRKAVNDVSNSFGGKDFQNNVTALQQTVNTFSTFLEGSETYQPFVKYQKAVENLTVETQKSGNASKEAVDAVVESYRQLVQEVNRAKNAEDNYDANRNGKILNERNADNARENMGNIDERPKTQLQTKQITDTISSYSRFGIAILDVANAFKNLGNESLTAGQKMTGFFSTILMALPMITTSLPAIKSTLPQILGVITSFGPEIAIIAAAIGGVVAIARVLYKEYNKDSDAAKQAAKDAKTLKDHFDAVQDSYSKVNQDISNYQDAEAALSQLVKGTDDWNQKVKQLNSNVNDLLDKYPDLAQYVQNDNGVLSISDQGIKKFQEKAQSGLDAAQQNYLSSQVNSLQKDNASILTDTLRKVNNEISVEAGKNGSTPTYIDKNDLQKVVDAYKENPKLFSEKADEFAKETGISNQNLVKALQDSSSNVKDVVTKACDEVSENTATLKVYSEEIAHNKNVAADNQEYNNSKHQDVIDSAINDQAGESENKYLKTRKKQSGKDIRADFAKQNNLTVAGKGKYYDEQQQKTIEVSDDSARQILARADAYQAAQEKYLDSYSKTVNQIAEDNNKLGHSGGDILASFFGKSKDIDSVDLSQFSKEQIEGFKKEIQDGTIDLQKYYKEMGYSSADAMGKALLERSDDYINVELPKQVENAKEKIQDTYSDFSKVRGELAKGTAYGDIDKDEQTAYIKSLDQIKKIYPELSDEVALLNQTELAGTEAYSEALDAVNDKLSSGALDKAIEDAKEAREALVGDSKDADTIEVTVDDEDFESFATKLDAYVNAEHQIDIQVHTDAEQAFDEVEKSFNDINTEAAKIGDNFTVAGDDLRELNNVFPGILEGMTQLSDGSYQLNAQVAQGAIDAATTQVAANAQSVTERLKNESTLLHAKAGYYKQMAADAVILANSETSSDAESKAARQDLSDQLANIQQANSDLASQKQTTDQKSVADAANKNGSVMANNWANASSSAAQSVYEFASSAVSNMEAVAEQNRGKLNKPGNFKSNFKGQNGKNTETSVIKKAENALKSNKTSSQNWEAMAEQFNALAQASDKAANDIDGMIAQIGAGANSVGKGINNLGKGKAYNTDNGGKSGKGNKGNKGKGNKGNKGNTQNLKSEDEILKDLISDAEKLEDVYEKQANALSDKIKQIEREVNKLSKTADKTIRSGRSKTIDKEIVKLREEKDLYQQQIDLSKKQQQNEITKIKLYAQQLGFTKVQIDQQGNVLNYQQLATQYQQQYNDLLRKEAAATSKDVQDAYAKQAQLVQERWKNFQSSTETLQKYSDAIDDAKDKTDDLDNQIEELSIKKFTIKVEVDLEVNKAKRDWNQFQKEVVKGIKDDDYLGQAKARVADFDTYYNTQGTGDVQSLTKQVNATMDALRRIQNGDFSSAYGHNQQQALDDLKKYSDDLTQALKDSKDINKDVHEYYLDEIEKAKDDFDQQNDLYKQINDIIEHDANLTKLLHGDNDYEDLEKFYDASEKNNNQQLDFYRKQVDMWKRQMDAAEQGSDEWKKFKENWMSSVSDLNSAVEDAVQNLIDKYNNTINKIIKNTKDSLMGGDWQKAMDEWDKAKWNQDRYLDRASRATGVLDFIDNVNQAMNKQSPKVQKELTTFMDREVDDLNSMVNMRQIDLDIANKKLEVLQKQIALEDAQNAKTQMRLRRDSQGNYTYQYVADEDQTAKAQQDLRDSIEELRLLAKKDVSDSLDEMQDKLQDFFDKALELNQTYYDDSDTLHEKLAELQDEYFGEDGYCTKTAQDYQGMQEQLIGLTGSEFSTLLEEQGKNLQAFLGLGDGATDESVWQSIQALMGDDGAIPTLLDGFTTGVYQDNLNTMSEGNQNLLFGDETGLNPSWDTAIGNMGKDFDDLTQKTVLPSIKSMEDANASYVLSLQATQRAAGIQFGKIVNDGIDPTKTETEQLKLDNDALTLSYARSLDDIKNVADSLKKLQSQYDKTTAAAISAANAALKYWAAVKGYTLNDVYPGGSKTLNGSPNPIPLGGSGSGNGGSGGSGSSNGGSGSNNGNKNSGKAPTAPASPAKEQETFVNLDDDDRVHKYHLQNNDPYGNGNGNTWGVYNENNKLVQIGTEKHLKKKYGLATGGYTGEWADGNRDGRLAFLHQKELVLNKDDTKNMLSVVGIVRGIVNTVAGVSGNMLSNIPTNSSLTKFFNTQNNNSNAVQQEVHIDATFPNVESSQEIEKAFNNLVNAASQRANQNRRKY